MFKLTKKAIRDGRTYGRTDPNYRKTSLLKTITVMPVLLASPLANKTGFNFHLDIRGKLSIIRCDK